jgi:hypothetical protein
MFFLFDPGKQQGRTPTVNFCIIYIFKERELYKKIKIVQTTQQGPASLRRALELSKRVYKD